MIKNANVLGQELAREMRQLMAKEAIVFDDTAKRRLGQRVASSPYAHLATTLLNPVMPIGLGHAAYENPEHEVHKPIAEAMDAAEPEALKDTKLRYGGSDLKDDLLWKRDAGPDATWKDKLGGRIWHNPKTSIIGKMLGTIGAMPMAAYHNMTRGSHYNPLTDVATNYSNHPAMTSHLLGHAIDYNESTGHHPAETSGEKKIEPHEAAQGPEEAGTPEIMPEKSKLKHWLDRIHSSSKAVLDKVGPRMRRDIYTATSMAPGADLYMEYEANRSGRKALEESPIQSELLERHLAERAKPISAMAGGKVGRLFGSGLIGKHLYGMAGAVGGGAVGSVMGDVRGYGHELTRSAKDVLEALKAKLPRRKVKTASDDSDPFQ